MVKEQIIICIDNSEYMRNGDYNPTRMIAQQEAANLICGAKTQQNPETTVGILTMAGKSPVVQVALTTDLGKLLASLSSIEIGGEIKFSLSQRVAQLALKRRVSDQGTPNRRIIAFVGSPLKESQEELVKLGLRLKKNNIAVDVVNFGEESVNTEKLDAFINSVVSEDNSHLVTVPPGPHLLSDMLLTSPIVSAGDVVTGTMGGGDMEFPGVDPSLDPELAMALRISLEEERRRQERLRQQEGGGEAAPPTSSETQPLLSETVGGDEMVDDDEELRRAIELSLRESGGGNTESVKTDDAMQQDTDLYDDEQEMDEDEALRLALAMSQQQSSGQDNGKSENIADVLQDEAYMSDLLSNLGGDEEKRKKEEEEKKKREEK
jgi:26S proteasome regulatory subunit N10